MFIPIHRHKFLKFKGADGARVGIWSAAAVLLVSGCMLTGPGVHAAMVEGSLEDVRSVWDGVYSKDQAARGSKVYADRCASCHGAELEGGLGPPMKGPEFAELRRGTTVSDLFNRISFTMPADEPRSLTPAQYAEVVARLLEANGYPAGDTDLTTEVPALKDIEFKDK